MITVVPSCEQREYTVALPVLDIRDYNPENPVGIYAIGGFVAELMISLNSLHKITQANDELFSIRTEHVKKFFEELFNEGYPQGICHIRVTKEPLDEREIAEETAQKQAEIAAEKLRDVCAQYGLKFFLKNLFKFGITDQVEEAVLQAICQIHYH